MILQIEVYIIFECDQCREELTITETNSSIICDSCKSKYELTYKIEKKI